MDMEGFLTFIFFFIVTVYVLGLLGRMFLRYWLHKKQKEFEEQFGQNGGGFTYRQYTWGRGANRQRQENRKREGEVSVQRPAVETKKVNRDVGEYVDFEEIKEEVKQ